MTPEQVKAIRRRRSYDQFQAHMRDWLGKATPAQRRELHDYMRYQVQACVAAGNLYGELTGMIAEIGLYVCEVPEDGP